MKHSTYRTFINQTVIPAKKRKYAKQKAGELKRIFPLTPEFFNRTFRDAVPDD
jgi:hypothetical protein